MRCRNHPTPPAPKENKRPRQQSRHTEHSPVFHGDMPRQCDHTWPQLMDTGSQPAPRSSLHNHSRGNTPQHH